MTTLYWLQAIGALWFTTGLYLDGWAHENLPSTLETFFTPWHGVLYSGLIFSLSVIVSYYLKALREKDAETIKYLKLPIAGGLIFALGGLLDMLWHTVAGIEVDIEALYSPPHLVLAFGGFILAASLFKRWFGKSDFREVKNWVPIFVSLITAMLIVLFFVSYAMPISHPYFEFGFADGGESLGITGIVLQSMIITSAIVMSLTKRPVPSMASLMIISSLSYLTTTHGTYKFIPAIILSGLVAAALIGKVKSTRGARIFFFIMPATLHALILATSYVTEGLSWSLTLSTGSVIVAGFSGLLVSLIAIPPVETGGGAE